MSALMLACLVCAQPKEVVVARQPAVAGQFYPGDAKILTAMIDTMLSSVEVPAISGRLVGIQVPHAGYPFSGPTAAHAFKLLSGLDSVTVVMVGPKHTDPPDRAPAPYAKRAMVYGKDAWITPLGQVPIDAELAKAIVSSDSYFVEMPEAHANEHSLEVQLPFLQRTCKSFRVVPIMLFSPSYGQCERVGKAIAKASKGRNVVLLASSDLYHGYSYADAKRTDSASAGFLAEFDPKALYDALQAEKAQACGGDPVVAVMAAAREMGADNAVVLARTNSNDVTGERGGYCVGYSATAFVASGDRAAASDELSEAEQKSLLGLARSTVENYARTGSAPAPAPATGRLAVKRGAFVTLHEHGELRGCIGYVEAVKPLNEAVREMAIAASSEDPRFPPVGPNELGSIDIEITVLSPLRPLPDPDSVVVGRHGLVIRKGMRSGLLLPQVPVEQGWNRRQFLENTCLKAGLPTGAYRDPDARLYCFTGQVFGEKELGRQSAPKGR